MEGYKTVLFTDDSTGVLWGDPKEGDVVWATSRDENGNLIKFAGIVKEILEEHETWEG